MESTISIYDRYIDMVSDLLYFLPGRCSWLSYCGLRIGGA